VSRTRGIVTGIVGMAALLLGAPAGAQDSAGGASVEARLAAQEREIERLGSEMAALKKEGAAEGSDASDADPETTKIKLGFVWLETEDEAFRVDIHGRLMVDGRFVVNRQPDVNNTFQVRRGRIEFVGHLYEILHYSLGLEFGRTSGADFRNAYFDLVLSKAFKIRAGQMLLPFSDLRLTSSKYLDHPERTTLVASIVGNRDIGAMVHGEVAGGALVYYAGVFNGAGQNVKFDNDDDVDVAARVELSVAKMLKLSASYIFSPVRRSSSGPADLKTVGNQLTKLLDYASTNRRLGSRHRFSGGALGVFGSLAVKAEADMDQQRRVENAAGRRTHLLNWSWFVDAFFVLSGEGIQLKHDGMLVTPRTPFYDPETKAMGMGAWAVALRYEDLLADSRTVSGGYATGADRMEAITATLHWYLWKKVRLSTSYSFSHFEDGIIDSAGRRRVDEHAIMTRFAFYF